MSSYNLPKLLLFSLGVSLQGGETRLSFDGNNKRDPLFIQNGEVLVYSYDEREDLIRAVRVDMADVKAGPTPIFDDGRSHQTEIAYSPDGRWASYSECTGNLTGKLVIRDMDAKKQFEIKHGGRGVPIALQLFHRMASVSFMLLLKQAQCSCGRSILKARIRSN